MQPGGLTTFVTAAPFLFVGFHCESTTASTRGGALVAGAALALYWWHWRKR